MSIGGTMYYMTMVRWAVFGFNSVERARLVSMSTLIPTLGEQEAYEAAAWMQACERLVR